MALENILSQEMIQRLGWTLLHFVWQATAVAALAAILLAGLRKATANVRYIMACAVLGLIVLLPTVTITLVPASTPQPIAHVEAPPAPVTVTVQPTIRETPVANVTETEEPVRLETIKRAPAIPWKRRATEKLEASLPYLVVGWLVGVLGLSLWHLGGWAQLQRLKKHLVKPVDASLQTKLNDLTARLHIRRAVQLVESALVQVPPVVGWLRPGAGLDGGDSGPPERISRGRYRWQSLRAHLSPHRKGCFRRHAIRLDTLRDYDLTNSGHRSAHRDCLKH